MAVNPKTPGVYIEEIPVFPASIAGVATAVPAFMGYVEKAEINGVGIPFNTPTRITSLLEYETIFGKGQSQTFTKIEIADTTTPPPTTRTINIDKAAESAFKMYYNIQMYYSNGGGPCYIVPVGLYANTLDKDDILDGLDAIAKVDEPTLLLFPDAVSLTNPAHRKEIYDEALAQCETLKDRFTVMDVIHGTNNTVFQDAVAFRNSDVGPDNLKYGASYYPFLNTTLGFTMNEDLIHVTAQKLNGSDFVPAIPNTIELLARIETTVGLANQGFADAKMEVVNLNNINIGTYAGFLSTAINNVVAALTDSIPALPNAAIVAAITPSCNSIQANINSGNFATAVANYTGGTQTRAEADALIAEYTQLVADLVALRALGYSVLSTQSGYVIGSLTFLKNNNPSVYNSIKAQLDAFSVQINPSGAMAGIYARVDNERGVWKAPANVGVRSITGPSINVTNSEQDDLNVDATSGKSINVIRSFTGRGTIVWGARTLAGNDNEWRYINVRRLFTYVEESVQEATAFVVFEPNTANTWQRVIGMIQAFLTGLWRDGALAGATTKDAFFVRCGIGVTMTAQDILEGRMIVEIGMAAVRPAEFIILKFEHKLQES
jgi:hypothetical protein